MLKNRVDCMKIYQYKVNKGLMDSKSGYLAAENAEQVAKYIVEKFTKKNSDSSNLDYSVFPIRIDNGDLIEIEQVYEYGWDCSHIKLGSEYFDKPDNQPRLVLQKINKSDSDDNYYHHNGKEAWDIIDQVQNHLEDGADNVEAGYIFNIMKYLLRYPYKGNSEEDLNKAKTYIDRLKDYVC